MTRRAVVTETLVVNAYLRHRAQAVALALEARAMLDHLQLGFLYDLARLAPNGAGLEIGTFFGSSLIAWGMARLHHGPIVVIDPFDRKEKQRAVFNAFTRKAGLTDTLSLTVLTGYSTDPAIIALLPDRLAFAFIDGDHTEAGITSDIAIVTPRMEPGGILAFHDYTEGKADEPVKAVVDAWQADAGWEDLGLVGSVKAYRRPGRPA